jgi:hypothetical protein
MKTISEADFKENVLNGLGKDWVCVLTSHLDRHNDYMEFFVKQEADGYLISDDNYVVSEFFLSGIPCELPLKDILAKFDVELEEDTLVVKATRSNFIQKKNDLLRIMRIADQRIHDTLNTCGEILPVDL